VITSLAAENIYCGIHYPNPLPTAAPFHDSMTHPLGLPHVTQFAKEIFSLPMYPELTRPQVARVADSIRRLRLVEAKAL
jgi:dTDP-4-amino-4,6-dideoxygalactose transaminase